MRYCLDPAHLNPYAPGSPWIMDDEPDHDHSPAPKPRMRLIDGEWKEFTQEKAPCLPSS